MINFERHIIKKEDESEIKFVREKMVFALLQMETEF